MAEYPETSTPKSGDNKTSPFKKPFDDLESFFYIFEKNKV